MRSGLPSEASKEGPSAPIAALAYAALALILTWPLVLGIGRDVPGDLGDSLLNMWILAWGAEHLPRLVTFQIGWSEFWSANIFAPEPMTFALSEHLLGETLQILPIYWLTGNIILCYNLLFIASFALSGFFTFLLVRDITGNPRAAFVAGLIYGFLPYRIASVPHLQVLNSQWMPLALWGFNRFVHQGSAKWLAAAVAALVMQNWSCVYYLFYFAPFVLLYVLHLLVTSERLRDARLWTRLLIGGAATLALTLPFLLPYRQASELWDIARGAGEAQMYSANVWSYLTASENSWLWGRTLRLYPINEGETFLGIAAWLLALVALVAAARQAEPATTPIDAMAPAPPRPMWRRVLVWILAIAAATQFIALMSTVMFGGFNTQVLGVRIRASTTPRLLLQFMVPMAILLAMSASARQYVARLFRSPVAFFAFAVVLALWLSLGPVPSAGYAQVNGFGLYGVLHDFVPGFNGLRVPARFAMVAGLFLAILAGVGATTLLDRLAPSGGWRARAVVAVLALLVLVDGFAVPIEINRVWNMHEATPPARVLPRAQAPEVYQRLAALPQGSVITEFPFGDGAWEIRYVYYSTVHWKPITNGYSGGFPPSYHQRVARLQRVAADPEASWQSLRATGTTHVVLHQKAFARPEDAATVESWLRQHGAQEVQRFDDGAILFSL